MSEGKRIAVMQPYFYPYAGYFRLFAVADEFIVYDCVQFPRRGRVHRCSVPGPGGTEKWLTLPLQRQPRSTRIHELRFAERAREEFDHRLERLPWLNQATGPNANRVRAHLYGSMDNVTAFLEAGLRLVQDMLGFGACMRRSSDLELDPGLQGQDRILAICEAVKAERYINASGGRHLYTPAAFNDRGIQLEFLPEYCGRYFQMLPTLLRTPVGQLREDILAQCGERLVAETVRKPYWPH